MISDFYNTSAIVIQPTVTQTDMGGVKRVDTTIIDALPCRITARVVSQTDEQGRVSTREAWRLYCDVTADTKKIKVDCHIQAHDREWNVDGVRNPAMLDRHLELDLTELT